MRRSLLFFFSIIAIVHLRAQDDPLTRAVLGRLPTYTNVQKIYALDTLVIQYKDNRPELALGWAHAALHISETMKDSSNTAYFLTMIGVLHKNLADIDSAVFYYQAAITLQEATDFYRGVAGNYNNLATVFKLAGQFTLSLDYYRKALEIMRDKFNDDENTHVIYQNMAELYTENDKPELAWEILNEEELYHKRKNNLLGIAYVNLSKATLLEKDSANKALVYASSAATQFAQLKRTKDYCTALILKGQLHFALGNETQAFTDLNMAIDEARKNNLSKQLADGWLELAELYKNKNDYTNVKKLAQQSVTIYNEQKIPMPMLRAYKLLADAESSLGNDKQAYRYLQLFGSLNDSLNNVRLKNDFNQLQIKHRVSEKEKQILRLKDSTRIQNLENRQQQLDLSRQRTRNIYLSIIIIVALLSTVLFVYRYLQKQRLSRKLQATVHERDILLKEVHHRVKNNLQIINSLLNLQNEVGEKKSVEEVIRLTQDRIHTMSVIHEKLYKSKSLENISLEEYINSLCEYYRQSYGLNQKNISLQTVITNHLPVSMDQLITLGLVLNELVINSIKYAFDEQQQAIISVSCSNDKEIITFTVADNGRGLPADFKKTASSSLGMQLIEGFAMQLKARLSIQSDKGTLVSLTFKPDSQHG